MAVVSPKTEKKETYKTPGVPEDANESLTEEIEDLFGVDGISPDPVEEDVFSNLAKDTKDETTEDEIEPEVEQEPESEVAPNEEPAEELPEKKTETTEEVPESGDTDNKTVEEEAETPEEAAEETTDDRLAQALKANELLLAKINDGAYVSVETEIAAPVETPAEIAQSQVQVPSRLTPVPNLQVSIEGVTEEQFMEIQSDYKAFNTYFQDAVQRGVQSTHLQMNEAINTAMTVREQIGAFFKNPENKDIMPLHNKVKQEAGRLDASMPEASILEVLTKAGENVRTEYKDILIAMRTQKEEIIKTKKEAAKESSKPKRPSFAGTTGRREVAVTPEKISAAEQEVLDMCKSPGDKFNY